MNQPPSSNNIVYYLSIFIFILFLAGRFLGSSLFENNWSFIHWQHIPLGYLIVWAFFFTGLSFIFIKKSELLKYAFNNFHKVAISSIILLALFIIFGFDSFLYGGGNHLINQIAQTDTIIYRWFEYGSIMIVAILFKLTSLFNLHPNTAGYISWKIYAFSGLLLTLIPSLKLTHDLSSDTRNRIFIFVILFFGPQTLLYFGLLGVESILVSIIYWFVWFVFCLNEQFTVYRLLAVWFVVALGLFLHVTMLILVPAAIFVTLKHLLKIKPFSALTGGILVYIIVLVIVYTKAESNLEYAKHILFLSKKNLYTGYNFLSLKHIGDIFQLFFLFFPQIIISKYLFFNQVKKIKNNSNLLTLSLLVLSGNTLVFIMEPIHSIVLDAPRFIAYLSPLTILFVFLLMEYKDAQLRSRILTVIAVISLAVPLSILPVYTNICFADSYVEAYLEKNDNFYYEGCIAFRDAYFFNKEYDPANQWEWKLPTRSQNYLDFKAAREYALAEMYPEALSLLYKIKTRNLYWTQPRYLLASIQSKLKRYNLAKPEIDTCLMIEPYNKDYLISHYRYYRDNKDYFNAIKKVKETIKLFPSDNELKSDLAIYLYHIRDYLTADSLAKSIIKTDSTLSFPHLIRGFIAEIRKHPDTAIYYYEKFISLGPDEVEIPQARKKLNNLILKRQQKK